MATADPRDELDPYLPPKAELGRDDPGGIKTTGINLEVENPFVTIWTRPRATIRGIIDTNLGYFVIPLAMGGGVIQSLNRAAQKNIGDQIGLPWVLFLALLLGSISGVIGLYLGGAILGWTGRTLRGDGTSEEVRAALAWSQVPLLATTPLWILQLALIGNEMFKSNTPRLDGDSRIEIVFWITGLMAVFLAIWGGVTGLKCLGEVHRFSAWRALASVLLPVVLILVPIIVLALVFNTAQR